MKSSSKNQPSDWCHEGVVPHDTVNDIRVLSSDRLTRMFSILDIALSGLRPLRVLRTLKAGMSAYPRAAAVTFPREH